MRAFFALPITAQPKQQLVAQRLRLEAQSSESRMRWVPADNYHITLAFLGEVASGDVAELASIAATVVDRHQGADLSISQLEWFPSVAKPHLLAAVLAESAALHALQQDLTTQLNPLAVRPPKHKFRPHITLAYAPRGLQTKPLLSIDQPLQIAMNQLVLFESQRRATGNDYLPLHCWPIAQQPLPSA